MKIGKNRQIDIMRDQKVKLRLRHVAVAVAVIAAGLGVGLGIIYGLGASAGSSADTTTLARPIVTVQLTTAPPSPDERMNQFLRRSGGSADDDLTAFRSLAHRECDFTAQEPEIGLDVRAGLLRKFTGKGFVDDASALAFLEEAIRDYCPQYSYLLPN